MTKTHSRCLIVALSFLFLLSGVAAAAQEKTVSEPNALHWQSVSPAQVEGMGWRDGTAAPFDRLPARA